MNNFKKYLSLLLALIMVVGVVTPAMAAEAEPEKTTVVLTKVLLENLDGWPKEANTEVNGVNYIGQNLKDNFSTYFGDKAKTLAGVDFTVTNEDTKQLVTNPNPIQGKENTIFTTDKDGRFSVTLSKGKYTINEVSKSYVGPDGETITGYAAIPVTIELPMVRPDGTYFSTEKGDELYIYPKNTQEAPKIDKNFDKDAKNAVNESELQGTNKDLDVTPGATEMVREKPTATKKVGDTVPYKVETVIPQGAEYEKLVWTDTMSNGLTYNKDLTVTLGDTELNSDNYSIISTDRGFTLKLNETGLNAVKEAAKTADATITLKYSARVNKNAVPDKVDINDVALDYSNKPGKDSQPKEGNPSNQQIKVNKSWAVDGQNNITEADKNVKALFTLQEKQADGTWKDVDSHEVTIAENFEHTFTGLDNKKTYRVVEQVSGYEPEYVSFNNGVVEIKNEKDSTNPKTLNPSEPKVVTGGRRFVKVNENNERLAGASFYVKNSAGQYLIRKESSTNNVDAIRTALNEAKDAYNKMTAEEQESEAGKVAKDAFDAAQAALNEAILNDYGYEWGANTDDNVVVLTSNDSGQFEITGLAYAKDYELEEITAPDGYAKLTKNPKFNVEEGSYNSEEAKTELEYTVNDNSAYGLKVVNKKITIPQTGGIGSLIFIVAGVAIMGVAYVSMKRNREEA